MLGRSPPRLPGNHVARVNHSDRNNTSMLICPRGRSFSTASGVIFLPEGDPERDRRGHAPFSALEALRAAQGRCGLRLHWRDLPTPLAWEGSHVFSKLMENMVENPTGRTAPSLHGNMGRRRPAPLLPQRNRSHSSLITTHAGHGCGSTYTRQCPPRHAASAECQLGCDHLHLGKGRGSAMASDTMITSEQVWRACLPSSG